MIYLPRQPRRQPPRRHYDLEFAVLEAMKPHPGYTYSRIEIAEVCGITRHTVRQLERQAIRKLRVALDQMGMLSP